mgnify:CR=1 FL=1
MYENKASKFRKVIDAVDKYEGIVSYLKYLTENYGVDICINDFCGFLQLDKQLAALMEPYHIHKNPFCLNIKSNSILWERCRHMKRGILLKSEKVQDTFYGMCYCGVGEYIVPILSGGAVIGVISVGEFCMHEGLSAYRIRKISDEYGFDFSTLQKKFRESVRGNMIDSKLVKDLFTIAADYFSSLYSSFVSTHGNLNIRHARSYSNKAYILSHAMEFIKQNYQDKLTVKDISKFCHCSESYLNHVFKKDKKINISAYINKTRTEQAKVLLLNSNSSIAEIASKVGFSDPNYFSSVFKKISGTPPTDYKKWFKAENNPLL